jgi:hypothetical protein
LPGVQVLSGWCASLEGEREHNGDAASLSTCGGFYALAAQPQGYSLRPNWPCTQ